MCNDTAGIDIQQFQRIENCLDYQAYVYRVDPSISAPHYTAICQRLAELGRAEKERMGVVYIRASWGFCVIPSHGFPDIRLNFFNDIPITSIQDVMASICTAFEMSDDTVNPGAINV